MIKPRKPREWWLVLGAPGHVVAAYKSKAEAEYQWPMRTHEVPAVRVVEVISPKKRKPKTEEPTK